MHEEKNNEWSKAPSKDIVQKLGHLLENTEMN